MSSKSIRDLELVKQHIEGLVRALNAQGKQIMQLTEMVVVMHAELHPEFYNEDGSPKLAPQSPAEAPQSAPEPPKSNLIII